MTGSYCPCERFLKSRRRHDYPFWRANLINNGPLGEAEQLQPDKAGGGEAVTMGTWGGAVGGPGGVGWEGRKHHLFMSVFYSLVRASAKTPPWSDCGQIRLKAIIYV